MFLYHLSNLKHLVILAGRAKKLIATFKFFTLELGSWTFFFKNLRWLSKSGMLDFFVEKMVLVLLAICVFQIKTLSVMGGPGIAKHVLKKTVKSALKRGHTYLFDAMNILYSMCSIAAIVDLLSQVPAIPTRQIVSNVFALDISFCFYLSKFPAPI